MIYSASDEHLRYGGRGLFLDDKYYFDYTCSFVEFDLDGTEAKAKFVSDLYSPLERYRAWIGIFHDGVLVDKIRLDTEETTVVLYSGIRRKLRIRIMKLSEAAFAKCGLVSLDIEGELSERPVPAYQRRIEFVGDSITCAYGVDGVYMKDEFSTGTEDPLKGYAYLTAQKCRSEYQYCSWSGMGVLSCYVEETAEKPCDDWLFKDIYPYADSPLERSLGKTAFTPYDFSYDPQITVFFDGTNDHSWTKKIPERCADFEREYSHMLDTIRKNAPDTYIVCVYGIMGDVLDENIRSCVESFKKRYDERICYIPIPVQDENTDGVVVDWHPSAVSHEKMSVILSEKINKLFEEMGL